MSQTPIEAPATQITVTYSLEEILVRFEQKIDKIDEKIDNLEEKLNEKIDKLDEKVNQLALGQVAIKGDIKALTEKVEGMDKRLEKVETEYSTLVKDISDLKGVKSLIIPIIVAVITAVITVFVRSLPHP